MVDFGDALLRLTSAAVIGGAIGLDRELRGKPTGVRTLGIVALGAALVVLASQHPSETPDAAASSRVIQGIITGIGFLGAGVIVRRRDEDRVQGLTTAAAIWLTAGIGIACGLAAWPLVVTSVALVILILAAGRKIELAFDRSRKEEEAGDSEDG